MALGITVSPSFSWIIHFFSTRTLPSSLETCPCVSTPNIFSWPFFLPYFSTQYYSPLCSKNPRKNCLPCCQKALSSSSPWRPFPSDVYLQHTLEMSLDKDTNNFRVAKSTSQFSPSISLNTSAAFDSVDHALSLNGWSSFGFQDSLLWLWSNVKAVSLYGKSPTFKLWIFKDANVCSIKIRCGQCCNLSSVSSCWRSFSSTISHLHSCPQSVTLLACSLGASPWIPAVMLSYHTLQGILL